MILKVRSSVIPSLNTCRKQGKKGLLDGLGETRGTCPRGSSGEEHIIFTLKDSVCV